MTDKEIKLIMRVLECSAKHDCYDLWWRTDGEYAPVTFLVNCNDLFYWAYSDAETITQDNISVFETAFKDASEKDKLGALFADLLFCCRIREMRPQGACYDNIPNSLWTLFDACGPERG